ncbi:uncharacterized protein [Rutidosis leptorrhynchoides]|uniref:uncharacterized protein n=1 Tax=Rutidosis leptorrhynchoides TaxID=125765 RepID=UPI003A9944D6
MAEFTGFMVHVIWGGRITFQNGWLTGDETSLRTSFPIYQKINYMQLNEMAYKCVGVDPRTHTLKMIMWDDYFGNACPTEIHDDRSLESMIFLASQNPHYIGQIKIQFEQLQSLIQSSQVTQIVAGGASTSQSGGVFVDEDEEVDEEQNEEVNSDDGVSTTSEGSVENYSVEGDISEDDQNVIERPIQPTVNHNFGFLNVEEDSNRPAFDEDDGLGWDCYNDDGLIRRRMVFRNKEELVSAVRNWNIDRHREIFVEDSRPSYYEAICYTNSPHYNGPNQKRQCSWMVAATMKNKDRVCKITKWFDGHICYGSVRIAIERLFGTWQSNLAELPTYVDELLHTNPDTIVRWMFGPQVEYGVHTFKYVFWAFGPAIMAYQQCIPIVCIDGTLLKGNYIGKMLTTVAKNANGQILHVAFAVVDNESNESILNAMANQQYGWHHRYCLRHIRSNLMTKFNRNTELKKLCWRAGSTMQSNRYKGVVCGIKTLNEVAWKYLEDADHHK